MSLAGIKNYQNRKGMHKSALTPGEKGASMKDLNPVERG
jgi:hypothetical protein